MELNFPVFVLASSDGVLVVKHEGHDCILLFHEWAHALRHIAETKSLRLTFTIQPLAIPDAGAFRRGLESLPANIKCAIWDATLEPGGFVSVGIHEVLGDRVG